MVRPEFMRLIRPVVEKAGELGIVNPDTIEFTDRFQTLVATHPDTIRLHAAVLVINDYLRGTNQSVAADNVKVELALFVLGTLLDARTKVLEERYQSLLEELEKSGKH